MIQEQKDAPADHAEEKQLREMANIPRKRGLTALAILASAQLLVSCSPDAGASNPAPPDVDVANVIYREIEDWDVFNGRVAAHRQRQLQVVSPVVV
ncbi:hypothetical protein H8B02_07350 [Bradyrhizobium sp. Pear77]|uniref:hypothetical protein n=1 Tax=Bradyrhizobium altum TaxID=1571202 RepID=UPI001E39FF2A|nr:hypothetical protein [Bradyrhizobium altum]MCC8953284.1 hypothetical protein [Bradyrhizobium altum]